MTLFARVIAGAVQQSSADLPGSWRLDDGRTVSNPTLADLAPDGWVEAAEVRPALGAGQRHGPPAFAVNGGRVVATYPAQAPPAEETNGATLRTQAEAGLTASRSYLALPAPASAQVAGQVRALTLANVALARLILGRLDGTT